MRRLLTLVSLLGCYVATAHTSQPTTETFGDWSAPVNVGAPINTTSNDNYAVLTRDELTMYFTSDRLGSDDLWVATRESVDSPWREPQNMTRLNTPFIDSLPFLSSNEHVLYFYSTRPAGSCGGPGPGDIWMTRRRNKHSDWGEPINLGCALNSGRDDIAPSFFEDPETEQAWLFYGSDRVPEIGIPGIGDYDVYASPIGEDGSAGPGILIPEFSSPLRDTRIFIRKDGLEAFITSNRTRGQGGIDIWTSTRETLSQLWSVPINLGSPVNSPSNDGAPWLSKNGTTLYFFSDRPGGVAKRDIYYTTRVKLND